MNFDSRFVGRSDLFSLTNEGVIRLQLLYNGNFTPTVQMRVPTSPEQISLYNIIFHNKDRHLGSPRRLSKPLFTQYGQGVGAYRKWTHRPTRIFFLFFLFCSDRGFWFGGCRGPQKAYFFFSLSFLGWAWLCYRQAWYIINNVDIVLNQTFDLLLVIKK